MIVLVALAGGLGAVARLLIDGMVRARTRGRYPLGTMVVNFSGSLLLGLVVGLAEGAALSESSRSVLGTGFLGGYTTFSTATVETVRLALERRWSLALVNGVGMLVGGVTLAVLGLWLGLALAG